MGLSEHQAILMFEKKAFSGSNDENGEYYRVIISDSFLTLKIDSDVIFQLPILKNLQIQKKSCFHKIDRARDALSAFFHLNFRILRVYLAF